MREILLATSNPAKANEMREILNHPHSVLSGRVCWRMISDLKPLPEPVEDQDTFLANAELKARHYARLSGLWTVADDSGLEVDALNGEPGVRSARFAGEPPDDRANNQLLIRRLADIPPESRSARFRCAVVVSDGRRVLSAIEGVVDGRIIDQSRGANGFGYDPHFWYEPAGMTTAEMSPAQKHSISHRGRALRELLDALVRLPELSP